MHFWFPVARNASAVAEGDWKHEPSPLKFIVMSLRSILYDGGKASRYDAKGG